jgi:Amiloride-sensitive sodium channel
LIICSFRKPKNILYAAIPVSSIQPQVKVFSFTFADFLSNIGGFMGLLAGISVLSIIEFFYLAVVHFKNDKVQPASRPKRVVWVQTHPLYSLTKYFSEFLESSDIHGLHYLRDQGRIGKCFWAFLLVMSVMFCSVMVSDIYEQSEKSPVRTTIDDKLWTMEDVRNF